MLFSSAAGPHDGRRQARLWFQHDRGRVYHVIADDSVHEACREVLLLLKDVLVNSADSSLTEAACTMMGRVLGQQEYMLRTSRVSLWSRAAVRHMDALVQLYAALVNQVSMCGALHDQRNSSEEGVMHE